MSCIKSFLALALGLMLSPSSAMQEPDSKKLSWNFESDTVDKEPAGFEFTATRKSPLGKWVVRKDDGNVLAQIDNDKTDSRFALAVVSSTNYRDVKLSVGIKPISGEVDQTGGLVWRYQDKDNYYVLRTNVLEKNIRLYHVFKGTRTKFAGKEEVLLQSGEWHTIKVEHVYNQITVYLNNERLFDVTDRTFMKPGKIGLWTKADSVTYFDDLTVDDIVAGRLSHFTFGVSKIGELPLGFETSATDDPSKTGRWTVDEVKESSDGRALVQTGENSDSNFPLCLYKEKSYRDVRLTADCFLAGGKTAKAFGLVFRYQDAKNHYSVCVNAMDSNIRVYSYKDGVRKQLTSVDDVEVKSNKWHSLVVVNHGNKILVAFNGLKIIDITDDTFAMAGKIGLRTRADTKVYFDDIIVEDISAPKKLSWNFNDCPDKKTPKGFLTVVTGDKKGLGEWIIKEYEKGNKVLVQSGGDDIPEGNFPLCVVKEGEYKNLKLSVKGMTLKGQTDRAIGLVWRYKDENNYYIVRANALEGNVRLYYVKDGNRKKITGKEGVSIKSEAWHTLAVEQNQNKITVHFNGEKMFDHMDEIFSSAGKIGLWTKADSMTYFDDFTIESLD